jgi:hypothetical protein
LNPTTTFWPDVATLVSLWVFCGEVPSSATQLTWTLPVVLFSAGQPGEVPSGSDVVGPVPWMMLAATWAAPSSRGLPAQAGADPDAVTAEAAGRAWNPARSPATAATAASRRMRLMTTPFW